MGGLRYLSGRAHIPLWFRLYARCMRFINLFLIEYFVLALGIGVALWQVGFLRDFAPVSIAMCVLVTMGIGIMLSVKSGRPAVAEEIEQ